MDVTVVGATGNVGTALLDALSSDADVERVRAVARRPPERSWPKTTFVAADVATDDLSPAVAGADAVVHLAWIFQPTHRPEVTWRINVGGAGRVFDAAVAHRVPVVVCASSVGAYSPAPGREVDESWPTDSVPTAAYGREKAYVERLLDALEARHPELRIVRMRSGFIFQRASGSQQRRLFAGPFVPASLLRPGVLPILPFPDGLRFQTVHARDVAKAYHLALGNSDARGAYNLAAEPVIGGRIVADLLGARLVGVPPKVARASLTLAWLAHVVPAAPTLFDLAMGLPTMRTDRARHELAWSPQVPADDALAEALAGMRDRAGGDTAPLAGSVRSRRPPAAHAKRRRATSNGHG